MPNTKVCTAPDRDHCPRPAKYENGYQRVHTQPLCATCYTRILRQNTVKCSVEGCTRTFHPPAGVGRLTPKPHCREHEHLILEPQRAELRQRLAARIDPNWETGCWHWTKKTSKDGYGLYGSPNTRVGTWSAHRFAWHLFFTGHSKERQLDHRCNNSICVNPFHLQVVTPGKNQKLRHARQAPGDLFYADNEVRAVNMQLYMFAALNELPLKDPETDLFNGHTFGRELKMARGPQEWLLAWDGISTASRDSPENFWNTVTSSNHIVESLEPIPA